MTNEDKVWIRVGQKLNGLEMTDEEFEQMLLETFDPYQEVIVAEDENRRFGAKRGPVGIIVAKTNGYLYEPHVTWFPWANGKNKVRVAVSFFQKFRYRQLGVIRVHALEDAAGFFKRLKKYVPLFYVGKIPGGDEHGRGDDFIFYMKCRGAK
jgi:hypothetical protein